MLLFQPNLSRPVSLHTQNVVGRLGAYRTRLEIQAETSVALDVEYMHLRLIVGEDNPVFEKIQIPCEVCLIDSSREPLIFTAVDSLTELKNTHPICRDSNVVYTIVHDGGRSFDEIEGQPRLSHVREVLLQHMRGRLVIGHNLSKDLAALNIDEKDIPDSYRRDTMKFPRLQNEKGNGRALAELSVTKLGREIQKGPRHNSMEDALATLDLYLSFCHYDETLMEYDDLVEYHTSQMLQNVGNAMKDD